MAKKETTMAIETAATAKTGMTTWESIMADTSLTMEERVAAFQQLKSENRAQAARAVYEPKKTICKTDADYAAATAMGPKVFAKLVSEYREIAATGDWQKAPLVSFASVYGVKKLLDGRFTKPLFKFLTFGAQDVALGNKTMSDIDFEHVLGNGGRYCERLTQLALEYQRRFGNLSFLAEPVLTKKA